MLIFIITAVFVLTIWFWRAYAPVPLLVISADDLARAIHGWEVTQGNFFPSDLWPPLQFWLQALATPFSPSILQNTLLVNVAATTATLLVSLLIGKFLGLHSVGIIFLTLLVTSLPWFIWLGVSGMSEPLFFLGIVLSYYGILRWYNYQQSSALWLAASGLLMASMVRFDSWAYIIVFVCSIMWCKWRSPSACPKYWYIIILLPVTFMLWWLGYMYFKYGSLFHFADVTRNYYLALHPNPAQRLSLVERITAQPHDLLKLASLSLPLGIGGICLQWNKPGIRVIAIMWLAGLLLLMRSTVNYIITMNNPERLVVILVLLLAPWATILLQHLWQRRLGKRFVVLVLLAVVVPRIFVVAHPTTIWEVAPDGIAIRKHLIDLRNQNILEPDENILIEVVFWDFVLLKAMTETPGNVVYDREPALVISPQGERTLDDEKNPSIFVSSIVDLQQALHAQNVRVVIVADTDARAKLQHIAKQTIVTQKFAVFVINP